MKFLRRKNILHPALVAGLLIGLCLIAAAQRTTRKAKGPRALALVEWPAKGGSPRVIPVTILVDGRYYDAAIYKADPVPMALDPGTVYDVEQSGESVGLVTLTAAREASNGAWLADARFQTGEQVAAAHKPPETAPQSVTVNEGPPRLRRGGKRSGRQQAPPPSSTPTTTSEPQTTGDDQPPVLRKPANEKTTEPSTPAGTSSQSTASTQAGTTSTSSTAKPSEPDHPVLRRGRPTAEQAENLPGAVEPKAAPKTPAAGSATKAAAAAPGRVLPAISDADGPEPHSFVLPWKAMDQEKLRSSMTQLASAALQDWARTHGGTHPGALQDVQLRAFDLTSSNEPQVILMARAIEAAPVRRAGARSARPSAPQPQPSSGEALTYWVTIAARQNYDGELRKLKVWATDSRHLDAYPRAELIDAVDADGDGRGELLFREIYDNGQNFALYRATPDILTQLYNSAELER